MKTKKPLTDRVYREIYLDIINGEILPDEYITESQLIERFGVSKSPVREALIMLCNENVLECIPRRGYRVVLICRDELEQIVETRQALELFMFERAFPRLNRRADADQAEVGTQHRLPPGACLLRGEPVHAQDSG